MTPSWLSELLAAERLIEIVDVGANPIDGEPSYRPLLDAGLARLVGFEPQREALAQLQALGRPNETYLAHAIGDGGTHTLHVCEGSGMTSLLEPDPKVLALFEALRPLAVVKERLPVRTRKLDDVAEVKTIDFLKLDVQGAEKMVLRSAATKLARAVAVQLEVSFLPLYRHQPCFGELDVELRARGFVPHCFAAIKRWPIAPLVLDGDPRKPLSQLLEADLVYVRDFSQPEALDAVQLKHLALIAHHCYGSLDLALRCVLLLESRGVVVPGTHTRYLGAAENGQR